MDEKTAASATCPKCGRPRPPGALDCPACGVVFARYDPERLASRRAARAVEVSAELNPYQAPSAAVLEEGRGEGGHSALRLAARGSRLVASLIDSAAYVAVWLLFLLPILLQQPTTPEEVRFEGGCILAVLGGLVLLAINLHLLAQNGQTVGKKLMRIRIVRSDGDKASLARLFLLRMVVPGAIGAIPYLGGLASLVDVLFIFREDRRCVHDHLADTVVIEA